MERATVYIDWPSVPGYLSPLEDSPNLIEGDVDYLGELTFDVKDLAGHSESGHTGHHRERYPGGPGGGADEPRRGRGERGH